MKKKKLDFLEIGCLAARVTHEKKALDIGLWDVHKTSSVSDYYLLASASSSPQLTAIRDSIDEHIKTAFKIDPSHRDGRGNSPWIVLDYGNLVIHLMHQTVREFYALEHLWEEARPIDWRNKKNEKKRTKTT
jgi:ribosome-associated protein